MTPERFYTARGLVVFMGLLGLSSAALGAWLLVLGAPPGTALVLSLPALVLVPLAVIEWRVPALEIDDARIVVKHARLRAPFVAERPKGVALELRPHLLGFRLVATNGESWVTGRTGELALDGGRALLVPCRALGGKARVEAALRSWTAPRA